MTDIYYHSVDPRDDIFCNNVYCGKGRLIAVSFSRGSDPRVAGMRSPYEAFTREGPKEAVFERIRGIEFPSAAPRMGSIFLFDSVSAAQEANVAWWQEQRVILEAEVVLAHRIGKFDSALLNASEAQWEEAARAYWSGAMSASPRIEVLVDGIVQLRGWESYGRPLIPSSGASRS